MAIKISGTTVIDDNRAFISYGAVHNALGSISGAQTINLQSGNFVSATIAAATTFTFSNPLASPNASSLMIELTNGGNFTVIWPASVKWPSGTAPTLTTNGIDVLVFISDDGGTTWRGLLSMKDSR